MRKIFLAGTAVAALIFPASAAPIPNLNPPTDCSVNTTEGSRFCMEKPDPLFGRSIVETSTEFVMGACSGGWEKDVKPTVDRIVRSGKRLRLTWSVDSACLVVADNVEAANRKVCVDARPLGIEVVGTMHPSWNPAERLANYRKHHPSTGEFFSGHYDTKAFHNDYDPAYLKRDLERNLPLYRMAVFKQMFRDLPNPGHWSPAFRERKIYTGEMTRIFGACGTPAPPGRRKTPAEVTSQPSWW